MKIFDRLADAIIARAMRTPFIHLTGYMERYWLAPYPDQTQGTGCGPVTWRHPIAKLMQRFDKAARVHHILRSDDDRAFHDHPWPYLTIVLRGGYTEVTPRYDEHGLYIGERRDWKGPGSILFRPANSWHRLELPAGQTAWTLFITGKWQQKWGFLTSPKVKTYYREYLNLPERKG